MLISKKKYEEIIYSINVFRGRLKMLDDDAANAKSKISELKKRIWKLENPPKFSIYQELPDGSIVTDLRASDDNWFGSVSYSWEYNVINKNEKTSGWFSEFKLEEKISELNNKQTNKNKKK